MGRLPDRWSRLHRQASGCSNGCVGGGRAARVAAAADPAGAGVVRQPANGAVDGEAHGSGEPALAPTPTPDDAGPPDAGNSSNAAPGGNAAQ